MSNTTNVKVSNDDIDWFKKSIFDEYIEYYDYSDFKNILQIGKGAFGNVHRANWKNTDTIYALKSFNDDQEPTLEEVIKEVKLHCYINRHDNVENIIKFHGITMEKREDGIYQYTLVLEYADSGTLQTYLNKHFDELGWNDKLDFAQQLANAVLYLHECDIIHRDLHANNILVHQKTIKLADFGLSKKIAEASSGSSKIFGVIPYIDPKKFDDRNYKLNKKSDIYSVGVIMWQISSGHRPFNAKGVKYDICLTLAIQKGEREKPIDGTPNEYSNLYTKCWKHEPNERPDIQKVVSTLKSISLKRSNNEENNSLIIYNSYKETTDINDDLFINTISIKSMIDISNLAVELSTDKLEYCINNSVVDKLIEIIIEKHNQGITFNQIQEPINQQILQWYQNIDNLKKWLLKNQDKAKYIWFLGLFYYYIVDTEENSKEEFELFLKASSHFLLAKVYLAKCYIDGYGTEQDKPLAFKWYQKSAENGSIIGQFYLGYCYENGIGIIKDEKEAVDWYKKAVNNKNMSAILYLANCYRFGKGIKKDEIKAFKYYEILAKQEISDAQQQLGNCLFYGIGTKADKDKALSWYTKAATNENNIIVKDILKKNYDIKIKIKPNKTKFYKILFTKKLSQLGLNYIGKILIKANYEKAFYYFQKSAADGNKIAQFNLGNCYRIGEGVVSKNGRKAFEWFKKSAEQGYMDGKFRLGYCYHQGIGTDIDKVKAFELYTIAAEKGNCGAQNNLGILYENGDGIEKNLEEAFNWYKKAAEDGNEVTICNLGNCYRYGKGADVDNVKAFKFYEKSAKQGYQDAQYQVANCYSKGIGTEVDNEKAFELCKKVAEKGNSKAQNMLGILYENGNYLEKAFYWYDKAAENGNEVAQYTLGQWYEHEINGLKSEEKAFDYYKKSAKCGHTNAQYRLAYYYDKGIGTEVDKEKAFKLYKKAAEKENKFAQSRLGFLYEKGEGTEENIQEAFNWYEKAENGSKVAQYNLGIYYENGKAVTKDTKKAFEYYRKSAEQEFLYAEYKLAHCYDKGIGTDIDKEEAFRLYKIAAEKGSSAAQNNLGLLYKNGEGTKKDLEEAINLYKKAAENGSEVAQHNLGNCYRLGIGVDKDDKKAFEFYKKSAKHGYIDGIFQLGNCYDKGIGTNPNKKEAFKLYKEAAEHGHQRASYQEVHYRDEELTNLCEKSIKVNQLHCLGK